MTATTTPPAYSSANGQLVWVVYDANAIDVTKLNYKYIADVYVNAVLVFRSKVYPNPVNNHGIFDLGTVIREYLSAAFKDEQGAAEFSLAVTVKFGEEYDATLYTNLITSMLDVFNTYSGRTSSLIDLFAFVAKPATDRPLTIVIPKGCTTYYLPYFAMTTTAFNVVINGVTTTITPTVVETMHRINIALPAATADYTVVLGGVTYQVKLICTGNYKNYLMHFLNKWGGWETMLFEKVSRKKLQVERKSWQQLPYRVDSSGVMTIASGSVMHSQKSTFGVQFTEKLKISTDWLSDGEYRWLAQLVCSPFKYLDDAGTLYPVGVENSEYEFKEGIVDQLQNLSVDIELPTKYNTQFQ